MRCLGTSCTDVLRHTSRFPLPAAFWADALHHEHEEIDAFVRALVGASHLPAEHTVEIGGSCAGVRLRRCVIPTIRPTPRAMNSTSPDPARSVGDHRGDCATLFGCW
jgi:hypothetical protein